jgi:hypothetical protein
VAVGARVANPAARALASQIKSRAAQLSRRRAEYGAGELAGPLEVEAAEMAEELNATETIFPGTKLQMAFKLVSD